MYTTKTHDTLRLLSTMLESKRDDFNRVMSLLAHSDLPDVDQAALGAQAGEIEGQIADIQRIQRTLVGDEL